MRVKPDRRAKAAPRAPSSLGEAASKLLTPSLAIVPVVLVILRVLRVAHGSYTTELGLINHETPLSVLFGTLAPVFPYVVIYSVGLLAIAAHSSSGDESFVYAIIAGALGIVTIATSPPLALAAAIGSVATVVGLMWAIYRIFCKVRKTPPAAHLYVVIVAAAVAFLLLQVGLDDRMWVPAENLTYQGKVLVVYPLQENGNELTVMDADSRLLKVLDNGSVTQREVCAGGQPLLNLSSRTDDLPTLLELIGHDSRQQTPRCSGQKAP